MPSRAPRRRPRRPRGPAAKPRPPGDPDPGARPTFETLCSRKRSPLPEGGAAARGSRDMNRCMDMISDKGPKVFPVTWREVGGDGGTGTGRMAGRVPGGETRPGRAPRIPEGRVAASERTRVPPRGACVAGEVALPGRRDVRRRTRGCDVSRPPRGVSFVSVRFACDHYIKTDSSSQKHGPAPSVTSRAAVSRTRCPSIDTTASTIPPGPSTTAPRGLSLPA